MSLLERIIVIGIIGTLMCGLSGAVINIIHTVNETLLEIEQNQIEHNKMIEETIKEM